MTSLDKKVFAELVGVIAIVASLVFVGMQLRQTQRIAVAEGYMSIFSNRFETGNSIKDDVDIWRKGTVGEELTEKESIIFAVLVNQINESAVLAYLHSREIGGEEAAAFAARDFAGFLYQNPGARRVWADRERNLARNRGLMSDGAPAAEPWSESVSAYLMELDRKKPPIDETIFVDW